MVRLPSIAEMSVNPINQTINEFNPKFSEELLNAILGAQARLNRRKVIVSPVKMRKMWLIEDK